MKKLTFLFLLAVLPLMASAYDAKIDGIYYNLDSNKKQAEVTYLTTDYSIKQYVYTGTVNIPEFVTYDNITYKVTSIGMQAFSSSFELTSVTIPNSVTSIGHYAFSNCSGMTSVTIGNSVTEIGWYAFATCMSLKTVTIPNSVTSIGNYAFRLCSGLTSISIPNSVTEIGGGAFYSCIDMRSVSIGSSVTSIGEDAFSGCSKLGAVTIPNSVTEIGSRAFENCGWLTSVTIGNGVKAIGSGAFYKCSALTEIYNYATTPQDITSYDFSNYSATLHVVPGYGATYRAANVWKDFQTIVEDATDGEPIEKPKLSLSASPSGGDVIAGTKVYLTTKADDSAVSGANIYYTLNGTTPSKNSTAYTSSGITINASCTLKAIAYKDGYEDSDVLTTAYNTVTITGITINETNFPDANFRKYLLEQDYGSDGVLTETEIAEITYMDLYGTDIENLKGIGYFKGLEYLGCTDNKLTSLDVSGCSNLRMLYCSINKLTSLNVSGCSMLNWLYCNDNQLTSLDMSGCPELSLLYVYQNKIKDAAMDAFIKSLPTVSNGEMAIIFDYNEGNVMTTAQVAAAKAKGWTPYYSNDPDMTDWQEYAGSEPEPAKKCATPVISITEGKLHFSCETEGVTYVSHVEMPASFDGDSEDVILPKVKVTVYAQKEGYEDSDVATKDINVAGAGGIRGDVNNDGQVGMPDAMFIVNKILNGKFPDE